jgi:hypothetical protein
VTWNERGIATASTLFSRTIGQTIGAGLAGAILNFGISHRAPAFGDALDLLLEPSRLKSSDAEQIAHLVGAVASSLHDVYIVGGDRAGRRARAAGRLLVGWIALSAVMLALVAFFGSNCVTRRNRCPLNPGRRKAFWLRP